MNFSCSDFNSTQAFSCLRNKTTWRVEIRLSTKIIIYSFF